MNVTYQHERIQSMYVCILVPSIAAGYGVFTQQVLRNVEKAKDKKAVEQKCYPDAVNGQFQQICSGCTLPSQSVRQLIESGFIVVPGPVSGDRFNQLTAAYDEVMAGAAGPDFKIASTTTRMSDLLNYASVFDDVYLYSPLLEACSHIIGEPFKLSSFLARTLRGGTFAQELHADLAHGSEDAPLLGFILMIDSFREENGATRFVPTSHNWTDLPCDRLSDTSEIPRRSLSLRRTRHDDHLQWCNLAWPNGERHSRLATVYSGLLCSTERAVWIRFSQSVAPCGPEPHEPSSTLPTGS